MGEKTDRAWVAGWDASLTCQGNPYKRAEFVRAFDRGKAAGRRATDEDVAILQRRLRRSPQPDPAAEQGG